MATIHSQFAAADTVAIQPAKTDVWSTDGTAISEPTIFALSSAPGRAAIAVIRISGPLSTTIYHALCPSKSLPRPRYAAVRSLYAPKKPSSSDTLLDSSALVLYFPAPRTATGEDILELHVHGGLAIVKAVLSSIPACASQSGQIRYAEPGEFTRRAFLNDRLDLTQVEALGDTLAATTEQQRKLSMRRTSNKLAERYEAWRQRLLYARGELEALIDFSEDQHFDESPIELVGSVAVQVERLQKTLEAHSRNAVRGELLRNGISLSLLGAPNAGKSSLLNRIACREAAIVSQEAGTTRDVVEVGIDLGGYLCRLGDTAGLRKADVIEGQESGRLISDVIGNIEKEGMRRAKERAAESDVVIVVLSFEPIQSPAGTDIFDLVLDSEVTSTAESLAREQSNVVVVINKMDQKPASWTPQTIIHNVQRVLPNVPENAIHCISCTEAESRHEEYDAGGIQSFLTGLIKIFEELTSPVTSTGDGTTTGLESDADASIWQESLGATERHRLLLDECQSHLDAFLDEARQAQQSTDDSEGEAHVDLVLAAEYLRSAADCLARITGKGEAGDVEEVLGVVFEKFCVGK